MSRADQMKWILALAGLMATPAYTQVAEIGGCKVVDPSGLSAVYCDVVNRSKTATAEVSFQVRVFEEGRTVPWFDEGSNQTPRGTRIAGGVEPGERRNVFLWPVRIPNDADPTKLRVEITPFGFLDVNGAEIAAP